MDDEDSVFDYDSKETGLAQERTELAWNRSGLAVVVTVGIVLRRQWPLHGGRAVIALICIAVGALSWVIGMHLGKRARLSDGVDGGLRVSSGRMLTVGTLVLAASGFIVGAFIPA
jgi:uncharacterized membrane protein YidH (DUF202 family)